MKKFTAMITGAAILAATVLAGNSAITADGISPIKNVKAAELIDEDTYMGCTMDSPYMTGNFPEGSDEAENKNSVVVDEDGNVVAATYYGAELKEAYPRSKSYTERKGIDISHWQNDTVENGKTVSKHLDFEKIKNAGYTYVIIKAAGRTTGGGTLYTDPCFEMNYNDAVKAGLRVGVYFYAQALNETEAVEEAGYLMKVLNGKEISLPVFYDYEWSSGHRLAAYPPEEVEVVQEDGTVVTETVSKPIPREERTKTILAFCQTIKNYGYSTGVYASAYPLFRYIDGLKISENYFMWVANYGKNDGTLPEKFQGSTTTQYYYGPVDIWQYTSRAAGGNETGVYSSVLDANLWYDDGNMKSTYAPPVSVDVKGDELLVFRMYNKNSGEHLYTTSELERDTLVSSGGISGWNYEGIAWKACKSTKDPVYRIYNNKTGEHLYSKDQNECMVLIWSGNDWDYEGIAWYSNDDEKTEKSIYRLYNDKNKGIAAHHYTLDENEIAYLTEHGWKYEGVAWYGKEES